jgi:hypothetical protein
VLGHPQSAVGPQRNRTRPQPRRDRRGTNGRSGPGINLRAAVLDLRADAQVGGPVGTAAALPPLAVVGDVVPLDQLGSGNEYTVGIPVGIAFSVLLERQVVEGDDVDQPGCGLLTRLRNYAAATSAVWARQLLRSSEVGVWAECQVPGCDRCCCGWLGWRGR